MPRSWLPAAIALVLLAGPARGEGAWYRARTTHFTLYASGGRAAVEQQAEELERMVRIIAFTGLGSAVGDHPRTVLIAFPDRAAFETNVWSVNGQRSRASGYAVSNPFGHWIGYQANTPRGRMVEFHEYTHTIVNEVFPHLPSCLREGLAEFFSTFDDEAGVVTYGHPIPAYRTTLLSKELFPSDRLFQMEASPDAPDSVDVFYAESWGFVHMLASQKGGMPRLLEFVQKLAAGVPAREAFRVAYPTLSWERMPAALAAYADADPVSVPERGLESRPELERVTLEPAQAGEVTAQVALWRVYQPRLERPATAEMFERALAESPGLPLARAGQGLVALLDHRETVAAARFREVAGATDDAEALSIAGIGLFLAAQGSPSPQPAWRALGEQTLRRVVMLDPHDTMAREQLERLDAAATISAGADSARRLANAGDVPRAIALLDELERVHPQAKEYFESARARIEKQRVQNAAVTEYNLGIRAVDAEDFAAAEAHFRRARETEDPELRTQASRRIAELAGRFEMMQADREIKRSDAAAALRWFEKAGRAALDPRLKADAAKGAEWCRKELAREARAGTPH